MASHNDDERERLSWREIDRLKDRSRHVTREKGYRKKSFPSEWAKRQFLKQAEKLFTGKKGSEEHKVAHNAIHKYYGSGKFQGAVKRYLNQYGLPDDWDTLLLVLDYKDKETVKKALYALKEMYGARSPLEKQGLKGKIETLALTVKDNELRELAEGILDEL
ncbi:MAG TPA: hypothetical protein EYP21_03035 [Syntrophaceae bacterium]|nr:hypothetical protein [Syntrophaceae bacterium]